MRRVTAIAICAVVAVVSWSPADAAENDRVSEMVRQVKELRQFCSGAFENPNSFEFKECNRAIGIAEAAHRLDPDNMEILRVLVDMLGYRSSEKSRVAARKLLALDPENADALEELYVTSKTAGERLRYLRRWAEADPEDRLVNGDLARSEFQATGDVAKVLKSIKRQIAISAEESSVLDVFLEFQRRGHPEAMVEMLQALLESSDNPASRCDRFFSFYTSFDREEILADSHQLNDRYFEQCGGYAYYRFAMMEDDPARKLQLLQKTLADLPDHRDARGELAVLMLASGRDVNQAMRQIEPQFRRNLRRAEEYLVKFAEFLQEKGSREDYATFLKGFVARARKGPRKCDLLKKLDAEDYLDVPEISEAVAAECADLLGN